mmetsp:Transcript_27659/g.71768  ORF Transcript_27659/g.71768 Transcript_27659/m.71768 type:complete len:264 (-) Transcript_27659:708-1499(-)
MLATRASRCSLLPQRGVRRSATQHVGVVSREYCRRSGTVEYRSAAPPASPLHTAFRSSDLQDCSPSSASFACAGAASSSAGVQVLRISHATGWVSTALQGGALAAAAHLNVQMSSGCELSRSGPSGHALRSAFAHSSVASAEQTSCWWAARRRGSEQPPARAAVHSALHSKAASMEPSSSRQAAAATLMQAISTQCDSAASVLKPSGAEVEQSELPKAAIQASLAQKSSRVSWAVSIPAQPSRRAASHLCLRQKAPSAPSVSR